GKVFLTFSLTNYLLAHLTSKIKLRNVLFQILSLLEKASHFQQATPTIVLILASGKDSRLQ
ncbi:MAG: hypothetical protein ACREPR_19950, partial [Brasilonema sp.]